MKRLFFSAIIATAFIAAYPAVPFQEVKFHDEERDTTAINTILIEAEREMPSSKMQDRVAAIGKKLLGKPYVAGTLDGDNDKEMLTVDMDEFDCTTYVETVLALAYTLGEGRTSWRDFLYNLERLRYRNGTMKDYTSRLHYASDWIVDNVHRGNFKDVTEEIGETSPQVKTLDFMTTNRDKYPALADDETFEKMTDVERGYRSHRFPYIKSSKLLSKQVTSNLRDGDIILITTKTPGLDVQHMGIMVFEDGLPHLMHASTTAGEVVIDKLPLTEYMRRNRNASGIRVIRLAD